MKVDFLKIDHFRNLKKVELSPHPYLNFFLGQNAQGKTSILEALGFLGTLRSLRDSSPQEVLEKGEKFSEIRSEISSDDLGLGVDKWITRLGITFAEDFNGKVKTNAFVNGKKAKSTVDYLSQKFHSFALGFHPIIFNPSDHELVRGEPKLRRFYLNHVISAVDLEYLNALRMYKRALEQRNAVLREAIQSEDLLEEFTHALIEHGTFIFFKRFEWLSKLSEILNLNLKKIAPLQKSLHVVYSSKLAQKITEKSFDNKKLEILYFSGQDQKPSLELIKKGYLDLYASLKKVEWKQKTTLWGPHRDDWFFLLGDDALQGQGSQGEIRSALLALKLSEIRLFQESTGIRPLFLLDDFSSELDEKRRKFLMEFLLEMELQVFVTSTEKIVSTGKHFHIVDGNLA